MEEINCEIVEEFKEEAEVNVDIVGEISPFYVPGMIDLPIGKRKEIQDIFN